MTISNCYNYLSSSNYIKTTNGINAGGLVGSFYNQNTGNYKTILSNSYSIADAISTPYVNSCGAVVGSTTMNNSEIVNCYYLSTVNKDVTEAIELTTKDITKLDSSTLDKSALANSLNGNPSSGLWTVDSTRNNGFPILKNNKANVD